MNAQNQQPEQTQPNVQEQNTSYANSLAAIAVGAAAASLAFGATHTAKNMHEAAQQPVTTTIEQPEALNPLQNSVTESMPSAKIDSSTTLTARGSSLRIKQPEATPPAVVDLTTPKVSDKTLQGYEPFKDRSESSLKSSDKPVIEVGTPPDLTKSDTETTQPFDTESEPTTQSEAEPDARTPDDEPQATPKPELGTPPDYFQLKREQFTKSLNDPAKPRLVLNGVIAPTKGGPTNVTYNAPVEFDPASSTLFYAQAANNKAGWEITTVQGEEAIKDLPVYTTPDMTTAPQLIPNSGELLTKGDVYVSNGLTLGAPYNGELNRQLVTRFNIEDGKLSLASLTTEAPTAQPTTPDAQTQPPTATEPK